jgi:HAD superfamily hydrolase (TIGR01549 family)
MLNKQLRAIIWDYDGTLVDTRHKNLSVTKRIVEQITGKQAEEFPALQSLAQYVSAARKSTNWREMYMVEYGMTPEQTDLSGQLWTAYQLQDTTIVPCYAGINDVLTALKQFPHGVVSQNARSTIANTLQHHKLLAYFRSVIGFEEVDIRRQKPEPDGLLRCIKELTDFAPGYVLYIGDHETDVRCARNAKAALQKNGLKIQVISIGAMYGAETNHAEWQVTPDYMVATPQEILNLIARLQAK